MKTKIITIWKVLTNKYHICFTYKDPIGPTSRVNVTARFYKHHRENNFINDVVNTIDKQDYINSENS